MTPRPPLRVTTPACGGRSPVMIRSSVVLPAPLAPTSATLAPSPTRNDTSSSSTRPSGSSYRTPATSTWPTRVESPRPAEAPHPISATGAGPGSLVVESGHGAPSGTRDDVRAGRRREHRRDPRYEHPRPPAPARGAATLGPAAAVRPGQVRRRADGAVLP